MKPVGLWPEEWLALVLIAALVGLALLVVGILVSDV
jgi:VIT1/CCC1 family predicted Fe2+/Mn2+ transporter